jgi:hypothetical protein
MFTRRVASLLAAVVIAAAALGARPAVAADEPAVSVKDQTVSGSLVVVEKIIAAEPGWIVIHSGSEGFPAIGATYVPAGESENVAVQIDVSKAIGQNSAMLHVDKGEAGKYEFPGADVPVMGADGKPINPAFKMIGVQVDDQFADKDGMLTINSVVAQEDGWIAIHSGAEGFPVLGWAAIKAGANKDVKVKVDAAKLTPRITAMIHVDKGEKGKYEFPGADVPANIAAQGTPAFLGGGISNEPFWTADWVRVSDQAARDEVTVNSVLAKQDGWIAIHSGAEGFPVIGQAAVKAGLNKNVKVKVDAAKLTPTVTAMLHVDKGEAGKYEFPGADVPVMGADGKPINPGFNTTGNAVRVSDQKMDDVKKTGYIVVDAITSAKAGWIAIHSSATGFPVLGSAYVHAGYNLRVVVEIYEDQVSKLTDPVTAMLHVDAGTAGKYEFPDRMAR